MTLQFIGPRQRGNLFPLGRAMLAALLIGGVAVAQAVATARRGVLSLGGARHLLHRVPAREDRPERPWRETVLGEWWRTDQRDIVMAEWTRK
jgi:hypothetical protein